MSLFGITTFTFAVGIIVQVLGTVIGIQLANPDSLTSCTTCHYLYISNAATLLMVRLCDAFLSSNSLNQWLFSLFYAIQSAPGAR
jgi:hypothetical protein